MGSKKTSAVSMIALFDILEDHGASIADIEKQTGIVRQRLYDTDSRISIDQFLNLWQIAVDVTGDPALGLHLRKNYGTNIMHFVIRLALNSKTLIEAVRLWARYAMLICEIDRIDLIEKNDDYIFMYTNTSPEHENRWIPEHHFSLAVYCCHEIVPDMSYPEEVWFKHDDPGYREEYEKIFRCPVFFSKSENIIRMKKESLHQPIIAHDPCLQAVLEKHANDTLERFHQKTTLTGKVQDLIRDRLHTGTVSAQSISSALNMDRSTLNRHLKKEGASFSRLLTQIRQDLAKKHLIEGMTATQAGYLLGFSEPSTFQRAFKNWFGMSPGEYRKTISPS